MPLFPGYAGFVQCYRHGKQRLRGKDKEGKVRVKIVNVVLDGTIKCAGGCEEAGVESVRLGGIQASRRGLGRYLSPPPT